MSFTTVWGFYKVRLAVIQCQVRITKVQEVLPAMYGYSTTLNVFYNGTGSGSYVYEVRESCLVNG